MPRWQRIAIASAGMVVFGPVLGRLTDLGPHTLYVAASWIFAILLFFLRGYLPSAAWAVGLSIVPSSAVLVLMVDGYKDRRSDVGAASAAVHVDPDADRKRIERARAAICSAAPSDRNPQVEELVAALKATKREEFAAAQKKLPELEAIDKAIKESEAAVEALAPPTEPDSPSYEKPEYSGAWMLSGVCRGTFNGDEGIVIVKRGTYFVVRGADPCTAPYMTGCVENTGRTVTLALGDGREAKVVTLADRETCSDAQAAYREEVAEARADYGRHQREYPKDLREWRAAVAKSKRDLPAAEAALRTKQAQREAWIRELAACGMPAQGSAAPAPGGVAAPAPSGTAAPAPGGTAAAPRSGREVVAPDCYGDGMVCDKARARDAERYGELLIAAFPKLGWDPRCFEISIVVDDGEPDVVVVAVFGQGSRREDPGCREQSAPPATKSALTKLAPDIASELRAVIGLARITELMVTNGHGDALQVPVR